MKKMALIIIALALFIYLIYRVIFALHPAIEVQNKSDKTIVMAKFYLPQSGISMDNVLPNGKSKIHYDLKQRTGVLRYLIILSDSTKFEGNCGKIENYELGKRTRIEVNKEYKVFCLQ